MRLHPGALALFGLLLIPAPAAAQSAPAPAVVPRLLIGAGGGTQEDGARVAAASVSLLTGRNFAVEGEWQRWRSTDRNQFGGSPFVPSGFSGHTTSDRRLSGWSVAGTALFRTEQRRVMWSAGGGLTWTSFRETSVVTVTGCVPPPQPSLVSCPLSVRTFIDARASLSPHATTGVEVVIAGPVTTYTQFMFVFFPDGSGRLTSGVRIAAARHSLAGFERRRAAEVAASARSLAVAPPPIGREVDVTFVNGGRLRGVLNSLSATDVVVRGQRHPLASVRLVERVTHKGRNFGLAGLGAGAGMGVVVALAACGDIGGECAGAVPVLAAIGGAGSALIGMLIDHAQQPRHVVWASPKQLAIGPLLTKHGRGVGVRFRW